MLTNAAEITVFEGVMQFVLYAIIAVFSENVIFSRALGVSSLLKLVGDRSTKTWQYCGPVILVQLLAAPLGWFAHNSLSAGLRAALPAWLPYAALRPVIFLTCSTLAMGAVWLLLSLVPKQARRAYREQLPFATYNCCVLGTLLVSANQNFTLLQTLGFGLGSGLGFLFAVLVVDEGRRRLQAKDVPAIFKGLPSTLIYIGILSLAIYGLTGHTISV